MQVKVDFKASGNCQAGLLYKVAANLTAKAKATVGALVPYGFNRSKSLSKSTSGYNYFCDLAELIQVWVVSLENGDQDKRAHADAAK